MIKTLHERYIVDIMITVEVPVIAVGGVDAILAVEVDGNRYSVMSEHDLRADDLFNTIVNRLVKTIRYYRSRQEPLPEGFLIHSLYGE